MKLAFRMLNNNATLNTLRFIENQKINQGEALQLVFQLEDSDNNLVRYVPTTAAQVLVEISRFPDVLATAMNQRVQHDYSVRRYAAMLFPSDDRSVWYLPLSQEDTKHMMSSNMRVTLFDGNNTSIALLSMAIVVTRSEYVPQPAPGFPQNQATVGGSF